MVYRTEKFAESLSFPSDIVTSAPLKSRRSSSTQKITPTLLSTSQRETFSEIRPHLEKPPLDDFYEGFPANAYGASVAAFVESLHDIVGIYTEHMEGDLSSVRKTFATALTDELQKAREIESKQITSDSWSFWKRLAMTILGAASIVSGGMILAGGGSLAAIIGGSAAILSGGATVISNVFQQIGPFRDPAEVLGVVGSGVCVVAGGGAFFLSNKTVSELSLKIAIAALSIAANAANIGNEALAIEVAKLLEEQAEKNKDSELLRNQIKLIQEGLTVAAEENSRSTQLCTKAFRAYEEAMRSITAQAGPLSGA